MAIEFFCPACGAQAFDPEHAEQGYCQECDDWTGDPPPPTPEQDPEDFRDDEIPY